LGKSGKREVLEKSWRDKKLMMCELIRLRGRLITLPTNDDMTLE